MAGGDSGNKRPPMLPPPMIAILDMAAPYDGHVTRGPGQAAGIGRRFVRRCPPRCGPIEPVLTDLGGRDHPQPPVGGDTTQMAVGFAPWAPSHAGRPRRAPAARCPRTSGRTARRPHRPWGAPRPGTPAVRRRSPIRRSGADVAAAGEIVDRGRVAWADRQHVRRWLRRHDPDDRVGARTVAGRRAPGSPLSPPNARRICPLHQFDVEQADPPAALPQRRDETNRTGIGSRQKVRQRRRRAARHRRGGLPRRAGAHGDHHPTVRFWDQWSSAR